MTEETTAKKTTEQRRAERIIKDLSHINVETIQALASAGLVSLQDLLKASGERIGEEGKAALAKAHDLKAEAEKLVKHVATGTKTPEGRKQLVAEGKDVAIKTAKGVEAQARDLLAKAQKDGEAAITKAKDLKEKAPEALHDYRAKAEAALKDADAKVRELAGKAPESVKVAQQKAQAAIKEAQNKVEELAKKTEEFAKTEFEKVKAANEGAITKVKARFNKD